MKVNFQKIKDESIFQLEKRDQRFSIQGVFTLKPKEYNLLHSLLKIDGSIETSCNSCSKDISIEVDEEVEFLLSNGTYSGFHDQFDVVEALDGVIDLDGILAGELELIESSGYHRCDNCKDIDLNLEF
jgi:hypothetical protein